MKLSANFTLEEMIKSQTAIRLGIDNYPYEEEIITNLQRVAINILQPVRSYFGNAVFINSGYRCLRLNRHIGSKDSSQHTKGQAADFEVAGYDNYAVAKWVEENLDFDQLILEMYEQGDPRSGWIHCSYIDHDTNRNEVLTIVKGGQAFKGLIA